MVKIQLNKTNNVDFDNQNIIDIYNYVAQATGLNRGEFFLEQNGKRLEDDLNNERPIYVRLCILGGKGGFGSMLRAIGAQIEKTTNREACRDLSGRRLRDINEEKRLKAWLEKQGEREREAEERKKRKIEKLLAVPKHDFKDEKYEEARSNLTDKVCKAIEEGFENERRSDLKRKNVQTKCESTVAIKKKKTSLWLDEDFSSSDESEDDNIKTQERDHSNEK